MLIRFVTAGALLLSCGPLPAGEALRLASDDWCPFVCAAAGKPIDGYLVETTARALQLGGYSGVAVLMPLNRAMLAAQSGAIQGVYAPPIDQRLRLSVPVYQSRACFYSLGGEQWTYGGVATLGGKVVGIIDDYGYDNGAMDAYIAQHRGRRDRLEIAYGDAAGAQNLHKLLRGRFGLVLEHEAVMARLLVREHAAARVRQAGCLEQPLPLTVGFAVTDPRSAAWSAALAEGLRQMEASGERQALLQRYGLKP